MATTLSKAALMRERHQAGMSVGDVARLFGVTYHYAYQVVVIRAGAKARSSPEQALTPPEAKKLTWKQLYALIDGPAESRIERTTRKVAFAEADRRAEANGDLTGKWDSPAARKKAGVVK